MSKEEFRDFGYHTPAFSLAGTSGWARIVACHDGDSPTVVMSYAGQMYKFHTRMYGIDTCEIRSKDQSNKERAIKARDRLIQLATGCNSLPQFKNDKDIVRFLGEDVYIVWVECMDFDKYARPLISMKKTPQDAKGFADVLIEEKLAYPYFGATKLTEKDQAEVLS